MKETEPNEKIVVMMIATALVLSLMASCGDYDSVKGQFEDAGAAEGLDTVLKAPSSGWAARRWH